MKTAEQFLDELCDTNDRLALIKQRDAEVRNAAIRECAEVAHKTYDTRDGLSKNAILALLTPNP